jgi:hypothetical protein
MNQNGFALIAGASGGLGLLLVLVAMVVCGCKSNGPRPERATFSRRDPMKFASSRHHVARTQAPKWPNEFVAVAQGPTTRFTLLCHEDSSLPCFYMKAGQVLHFPEQHRNFLPFADQPTNTQMFEIEKTVRDEAEIAGISQGEDIAAIHALTAKLKLFG